MKAELGEEPLLTIVTTLILGFCARPLLTVLCMTGGDCGDNLALLSFRKFIISFKKKEDKGQSSFS